ncbi:MAG TPA: hypothetical protein VEQ40_05325 [Pyrinomonadaceae bacterium]|nr:hypothetical protein [Pyrinomonadaceae bacterium]
MKDSKGKRSALWALVLTLVVAVAAPVFAAAPQGRGKGKGRGKDKKAEKFKNGHDARDGRWDGRGPRDDRGRDDDDWDDDDDRGRGRRRDRDRDRDDDGINDTTEIRRRALSIGYDEGFRAGQNDRSSGSDRDLDDHSAYRDATIGYSSSYGNRELYRRSFREGFRRGYEDGYRNRSTRSRGVGGILGDIFGRP